MPQEMATTTGIGPRSVRVTWPPQALYCLHLLDSGGSHMLRWRQHAKLLVIGDGKTAILWVLDGYVMTRTNTCVHSSAASSIQADLYALHTAPGKNSGFHLECSMLGLCFVCQDEMPYCSRST